MNARTIRPDWPTTFKGRRAYRYTIPKVLSAAQKAAVDAGGAWPVEVEEIANPDAKDCTKPQPAHYALIDFLIEEARKCSQG